MEATKADVLRPPITVLLALDEWSLATSVPAIVTRMKRT